MKKLKVISVILLVFAFLISLKFNINTLSRQKISRQTTINNLYNTIIETSKGLNSFVNFYEENNLTDAKSSLEYVAVKFRKIDSIISNTNIYAEPKIYNPEPFSFKFIADILTYNNYTVNKNTINSILSDDKISKDESVFVRTLTEDLDIIYKELSLTDPYTPNIDLSTNEVNDILKEFYSTWGESNSKSIYKLLMSEK